MPSIVTSSGRSTGIRTGPSERQPSSLDLGSHLHVVVITGLTSDAVLALVVEDEEAAEDPDLRRGEPDAVGVVHERRSSARRRGSSSLVEDLDLVRAHAQHRVAVLADLGERDAASAPGCSASRSASVVVLVIVSCSCPCVLVRRDRGSHTARV